MSLLLAAAACIFVLRETRREGAAPPAEPASAAGAGRSAPIASPKSELPGATPSPAAPIGYSQRFSEATDYLAFVRSIHEDAKRGDLDAQYYLFRALDFCHGHFRVYFGLPGKGRTYDEGLRWAARHRPALDVEEARRVYEQCRSLEEFHKNEFGEREQWLQKAALGGQPRAQMVLAGKLLVGSSELPEAEAERSRQDARDLVRDALRTKDPEVLLAAGDLVHLRKGVVPDDSDMSAWWLAACIRGLDCGPHGERTRQICRFDANCQPYESMIDMMRRNSADFMTLEAKAHEINRLIDAGDWAALGFGAPSSP